ncbi:hypothetical protein NESM_000664200 [Novymonas esmeraldas]|uniref:Uncharacterized protein n=1 Tax=Novymonas esmeraldas TaxID=1808958 RepID=A0AAW0ESQ8_9TRYP
MDAASERGSPARSRRGGAHGSSASPSLGRASSFLVRRPAPTAATRTPDGGGVHQVLASSQPQQPRRRRSLASTRVAATAVDSGDGAATADDPSLLPLDLLEPAAVRWASTAHRGGRRAPRVRSTVGQQSEVVDTGVFVCPDTVVAALHSAAPRHRQVVVTAEAGGWLRVRELQSGAIRHQQRLRDGGEVACLSWSSAAAAAAAGPLDAVVVVGQLSGLIVLYALVGESLVELPSATCVFHTAPLLCCLPLRVPATAAETVGVASGASLDGLLSLDADGVAALWCLRSSRRASAADGGGAGAEAQLSVQLLDCSDASLPPMESSPHHAAALDEDHTPPPVVVSAAALSHTPANAPCCILSSHRLTQSHDGLPSATEQSAHVFLLRFTCEGGGAAAAAAADLSATSLALDTRSSSNVGDGREGDGRGVPAHLRHRWVVQRAYRVPDALLRRRGSADSPDLAPCITAICLATGGSRVDAGAVVGSVYVWAGTADGRLLIWHADTGEFVRCLRSVSTSPVHSLTSVPVPGGAALGPSVVWACQADGSVVAWGAATYAVVEELPVSYPPPASSAVADDSLGGDGGGGAAVVTVRSAVDLVRATRHSRTAVSAAASSRRGGHFTLFLQPMGSVCMQRVWSAATDGTVRTWLLPTGDDSAGGAVAVGAAPLAAAAAAVPPRSPVSAAEAGTLDAHTVRCFLQERAEALAAERQAQRLAWEAQQEQLRVVHERNEILTAALQQAIHRLERVGVDGLVRSSSPPESPPTPGEAHGRTAAAAAAGGTSCASSMDDRASTSGSDSHSATVPSTGSDADGQWVATAAQPPAAAAVQGGSLPSPAQPAAQAHVAVLQQLLEELHARLEESWGRNDALREELLVYQLRALEREEDVMRRVREAAASEAAAAAAVARLTDGAASSRAAVPSAATAATASPAPLPAAAPSSGSTIPPSAGAGEAVAVQSEPPRTPSSPQRRHAALLDDATHGTPVGRLRGTPPQLRRSPSADALVHRHAGEARRLTPPPPLTVLSAVAADAAHAPSSVEPHAVSPSRIAESTTVSSAVGAAELFLHAASAALRHVAGGSSSGSISVPVPPLLATAADGSGDGGATAADEDGYDDSEDEFEPTLVGAWYTRDDGIAPTPRATGVPHTGQRAPAPASLFSYPHLSGTQADELPAGAAPSRVQPRLPSITTLHQPTPLPGLHGAERIAGTLPGAPPPRRASAASTTAASTPLVSHSPIVYRRA